METQMQLLSKWICGDYESPDGWQTYKPNLKSSKNHFYSNNRNLNDIPNGNNFVHNQKHSLIDYVT
jgi:hypothetical protein